MRRRGRNRPAVGMIIGRTVMIRMMAHTAGKSRKHDADQCHYTKTKHSYPPGRRSYCLLNVAVAFRPPSGLFSSVTSPPCMRAMLRAMDRPRPVPPVLRLRERSTL